jgi:hypothetical protein
MSNPEHVEEIEVAPVPDTEPPGLGELDPTDTYVEGVDADG